MPRSFVLLDREGPPASKVSGRFASRILWARVGRPRIRQNPPSRNPCPIRAKDGDHGACGIGFTQRWRAHSRSSRQQRLAGSTQPFLKEWFVLFLVVTLFSVSGCSSSAAPGAEYAETLAKVQHGDLSGAFQDADRSYRRYSEKNVESGLRL